MAVMVNQVDAPRLYTVSIYHKVGMHTLDVVLYHLTK